MPNRECAKLSLHAKKRFSKLVNTLVQADKVDLQDGDVCIQHGDLAGTLNPRKIFR